MPGATSPDVFVACRAAPVTLPGLFDAAADAPFRDPHVSFDARWEPRRGEAIARVRVVLAAPVQGFAGFETEATASAPVLRVRRAEVARPGRGDLVTELLPDGAGFTDGRVFEVASIEGLNGRRTVWTVAVALRQDPADA